MLRDCYAAVTDMDLRLGTEVIHRERCAREGRTPINHVMPLRVLGGTAFLAGLLGFIAMIAKAAEEKEQLTPDSHYLIAIWCFLLAKWGAITYMFTDKLERYDQDAARPLLDSEGRSVSAV
eukprot:m.80771 g.80771  ORF g.80771 m.80771 type:complete len:121 (-) comp12612_c0_seq1:91-453(-)